MVALIIKKSETGPGVTLPDPPKLWVLFHEFGLGLGTMLSTDVGAVYWILDKYPGSSQVLSTIPWVLTQSEYYSKSTLYKVY